MYPATINPLEMYEVADDFFTLDTVKWTSVDDGGTGTNTANAVVGGQVSIVTAASDNDYHFMKQAAAGNFKLVNHAPIWFVARVTLTEADTNKSNWFLGVSSVVDSTLLAADGAGPVTSASMAGFYKVDGDLLIKFITSNGATQTKSSTIVTLVTTQSYQLGFHWDPGDGTTSVVSAWVYDETAKTKYTAAQQKVAVATLAGMSVIYGIKAGGSSAETLKLDYIRCCQKRV